MDRISKAVERARKARQENARDTNEQAEASSAEPSYTRTRSVSLSQECLGRNHIITGEENNQFIHSYRVLRTKVWQKMKENNWTSVGITSCKPGEGKTLTSINLAISLAMMKANHSVLLVDFDLRRPSIHEQLGIDLEYGLNDYLTSGVGLEQILVAPGIGRFVILPGRSRINNSSEILSSARIEKLIQEFKTRYPSRITIFDLPPVMSTDDVLVVSSYIDAFILVVDDGVVQKDELLKVRDLLKGVNLLGTVLNRSDQYTLHDY